MARECYSCGSRPDETPFPVARVKGLPLLCLDCLLEHASEVTRPTRMREALKQARVRIIRRASYRAALRHRQAQAQGDLVDLLVRSPWQKSPSRPNELPLDSRSNGTDTIETEPAGHREATGREARSLARGLARSPHSDA